MLWRMRSHPLAVAGDLIGEPGRAAILTSLLDHSSRSASELAQIAGVSQQSASNHLAKLLQGGLLKMVREGRYRYYCLSSPEVANALEALGAIATARPAVGLTKHNEDLGTIRTCYDHMAGRIAVQLSELFHRQGLIASDGDRFLKVTKKGERWLMDFGISPADLMSRPRNLALRCLDWTERRPHIAGALGTALYESFRQQHWVESKRGTRALRITSKGSRALIGLGIFL